MAMEKLILRSVFYGVDKIPDTWFEKLPGGFFREKESQKKTNQNGEGSDSNRRRSMSDARKRRDEDYQRDDGYRSDGGKRRGRRGRSSYDGGADEDDYYSSGDDKRKSARDKPRRRRSFDRERREYDDRNERGQRNRDREVGDRSRYVPPEYRDQDRPSTGDSGPPPNPFSPNVHIPTVAPVDSPAQLSPTSPPLRTSNTSSPTAPSPQLPQPQKPRHGSIGANKYVPYAHIYGQPTPEAAPQAFSPPGSSDGPAKPRATNTASPIAPPPNDYQQNPFAQQAPIAVDAGAGAQYTGQPGFMNQTNDPRFSARRFTGYNSRGEDRRSRSERREDYTYRNEQEAREKYVDSRKPLKTQSPTQLPTQVPPPEGRKDDRRGSEYQRDGAHTRRDGRGRREQGYYSD